MIGANNGTDMTEGLLMLGVLFVVTVAYFTKLLIAIRAKHTIGIIKGAGILLIAAALWVILAEEWWEIAKYIANHFWLLTIYVFGAATVIIAMVFYYRGEN